MLDKTNEQLLATVKYSIRRELAGIVEKDGHYIGAKDWDEINDAKSCGYTYVGHPVDVAKKLGLDWKEIQTEGNI